MTERSISFVQLPLVTKPEPTWQENLYYKAYWDVMGRLFAEPFPQGEAYTIPELPLWVTRLSAVARRAGWIPKLVDLAGFTGPEALIPIDALAERVCVDSPTIVCLSPFTANYDLSVELASAIKVRHPNVCLLVGGAHATELARECVRDGFDFAITGRGEVPLDQILSLGEHWREQSSFPGIVSAADPNAAIREDLRLYDKYWDIPADYEVIPRDYAMHYARAYATLGCPYRCSFCADTLWIGMRPLIRDLTRLRQELAALKSRFKPRVLFVGDEVFTLNPSHCLEVISLLGEVGIPWFCQTRANLLSRNGDQRLLKTMSEAGCRLINIGAESTDDGVLEGLNKRITKTQLVQACALAKESGLGVLTYWTVGGPGETRWTAEKTIADIVELFSQGLTDLADYFICTPYPGTSIYESPDIYGVTIQRKPWRLWREDMPSVMSNASLSAESTYDLWLTGLDRIATLMQATL